MNGDNDRIVLLYDNNTTGKRIAEINFGAAASEDAFR